MFKTGTVLKLDIPKPCTQNWAQMAESGDGRHCNQCDNIIHDFSGMSDEELLNFFVSRPATHCGRFLNSQLRRDILPAPKQKNILFRLNKIAAAFITFLSFKSAFAKIEVTTSRPSISFDASHKYKFVADSNYNKITGTIRDEHGYPLENAIIKFDSTRVATSGKDGSFEFELPDENWEVKEPGPEFHHLYFSADSMVTVVRSFNRAMLPAHFNITLKDEYYGPRWSMGIMVRWWDGASIGDLPFITFNPKSTQLSPDAKAMLTTVAAKLRSTPKATITIKAYKRIHMTDNYQKQRVKSIYDFLVKREGITRERITPVVVVGDEDINIIEIYSDK